MQEKEGGDGVKQILVILGGGRRNGNTKQLADSFVSGAAQACLLYTSSVLSLYTKRADLRLPARYR